MPKRVSDCIVEAERLRTKARVYNRIRTFLFSHYDVGNGSAQIPNNLFNEVAEEMLVRASEAEQRAQLLMATPVTENVTAVRSGTSGRQIKQAVSRIR